MLYNSLFENGLRLLLLLDVYDMPQTMDMLYAVDFITVYGKSFGISDTDLNGENEYKFSEFVSRRESVQNALNELVLNGTVEAVGYKGNLCFIISSEGEDYCHSLSSEYAAEYRKNAAAAVRITSGKTEREIITAINKLSAKSLQEGVKHA